MQIAAIDADVEREVVAGAGEGFADERKPVVANADAAMTASRRPVTPPATPSGIRVPRATALDRPSLASVWSGLHDDPPRSPLARPLGGAGQRSTLAAAGLQADEQRDEPLAVIRGFPAGAHLSTRQSGECLSDVAHSATSEVARWADAAWACRDPPAHRDSASTRADRAAADYSG